jgi:hypothetical protein
VPPSTRVSMAGERRVHGQPAPWSSCAAACVEDGRPEGEGGGGTARLGSARWSSLRGADSLAESSSSFSRCSTDPSHGGGGRRRP